MLPKGGVKPYSICSMDAKKGMARCEGVTHTGRSRTHWGLAGRWTASPPNWQREGESQTQDQTTAAAPSRAGAIGDGAAPYQLQSGGGPGEGFLADTHRCNRGWDRRELQRPEDFPDYLAVRDGRNDL
jgi:hypothetical protein